MAEAPRKYMYRLGEHGGITVDSGKCPTCKENMLVVYEDGHWMCSGCGWDNDTKGNI